MGSELDMPEPMSFQERAEAAKAIMEAEIKAAKEEQAAKEVATTTAEVVIPFSWNHALKKSTFPFLVGVGTVASIAGLDWLLTMNEWQSRVAPYAVPIITAAATYTRNYLKQQAKMAKAYQEEKE